MLKLILNVICLSVGLSASSGTEIACSYASRDIYVRIQAQSQKNCYFYNNCDHVTQKLFQENLKLD